ncbi:hydroxyisourate hydrolase [Mycobacteroides franklinii]|uniref:5-hydroxyisourate hydrolase n=1 Tax=Mycobacteroides franklinii TaxID=948102 RepID=A0A4V3HUP3_9MYCO|nr:hydroxyisourate hydrolase [Mycobacteroides franklinii]ORA55245.1 hydroxyisourate hydrolase [Mycobacteroides franklinii]TDH25749.1 hydroxyisourate hydrolase [Mycobacteroides franklinii]TDZ45622.1 5-hydroxyisourate hydrolase precursor [Mycobacteroides franklinii]TDZ49113.1 5-hydroxyisourate hydrolase precursor [Mycobacteroides franklinii]TDZ59294.1 5-hydroxyisourate hydrolase precursor [Mycobacteroides franklinii]
MTGLSTHVLDAVTGRPARGVRVTLLDATGSELASGTTDSDGRIAELAGSVLAAGRYQLVFDTGTWFSDNAIEGFYPEVIISFVADGTAGRLHIPLLLSPYAYSTYRGS